jgi:predicted site-specific integrase-resolvase
MLGVCIETLRRWDASGYLVPIYRTKGVHRRYDIADLKKILKKEEKNLKKTLCYARVSSHDQLKDLDTQAKKLEKYCNDNKYPYELLKDLGSGLNFKKKGLKRLMYLIFTRQVNRLVINHNDRLLRFGSQLIFNLCELCEVEVVILENKSDLSPEAALVADVIEIMTVFSAKLYGRRSHKNKKVI